MHLHLLLHDPNQDLITAFSSLQPQNFLSRMAHSTPESLIAALAKLGTDSRSFLIVDSHYFAFVECIANQYKNLEILVVAGGGITQLPKAFAGLENVHFYLSNSLPEIFSTFSRIVEKIISNAEPLKLEDFFDKETHIHSYIVKESLDKLHIINEAENIIIAKTSSDFRAFSQSHAMKVGMVVDELIGLPKNGSFRPRGYVTFFAPPFS